MQSSRRRIVALFWVYFILLILEGALRKWVWPEWSNQLLIVRDPVAAAIVYLGARDGYLPLNNLTRALLYLLAAFAVLCVLQLFVYGVPGLVMLFGMRSYFLHPPMIFVMARVFDRRDLRRVMLVMMVLAVPIAWLMVQQFRAGPTDWLNRGAGLNGGQMPTSLGRVRPAGPFSFISGPVLYYGLVAACLIASHFRRTRATLVVQVCAWAALFVAAAVSGSRALVFGLVPVAVSMGVAVVRRPALATGVVRASVVAIAIGMTMWGATAVQEGIEVFNARMSESGGTEELLSRSASTYAMSVTAWNEAPIFGMGIGMGTNAGNALMGSDSFFRFGEDEWSRVIFEAGPIFGTAYLGWRVWLSLWLLVVAFRATARGEILPIALLGASLSNLVIGPWGQPTTQGFAVLGAGLCMAAAFVASTEARQAAFGPGVATNPRLPAWRTPAALGRSAHP